MADAAGALAASAGDVGFAREGIDDGGKRGSVMGASGLRGLNEAGGSCYVEKEWVRCCAWLRRVIDSVPVTRLARPAGDGDRVHDGVDGQQGLRGNCAGTGYVPAGGSVLSGDGWPGTDAVHDAGQAEGGEESAGDDRDFDVATGAATRRGAS